MNQKILLTLLLLMAVLLYAVTIRGIPGNPPGSLIKNNLDQAAKPFELSPERGRYILLLSLAENRSFALSKELADAAYPDVGYHQGRYYIFFAPGISLLAWPLYTLGSQINLGQVAAYSTIALFAVLNIFVLFRIARDILKLPVWVSLAVPMMFAFGSNSWSYAITMYQHHVTTFFIISSFYAVWKYRQKGLLSWAWAFYVWLCYAFALGIDYPNAVLMLPVMIYLAVSAFSLKKLKESYTVGLRLSAVLTSIGFIIIMGLHGYYNYVNFGSPTRLSGELPSYKSVKDEKLDQNRKGEQILQSMQEQKSAVGFFQEDNMPFSPYTLLIGPDRGVFLYEPVFLLAVIGILIALYALNTEINVLLGTVGAHFFLYSSWGDPWGGWAFGPRYMIPSLAVLSLFAGIFLAKYGKKLWVRIITLILFAYSSAIAILGAVTSNAIPPKIEADFLKMKYNFLMNYDFLTDGRSGSYVYNTYASQLMTLQQFALTLLIITVTVFYLSLFIVPMLFNDES